MAIIPAGDDTARRREWQEQTRLRLRLQPLLFQPMSRELQRVYTEAAGLVEAGTPAFDALLADHARRLGAILEPHWRRTWDAYGARFGLDLQAQARAIGNLALEIRQAPIDDFLALQQAWILEFGAQKVVQISETTRNDIADAVAQGIDEGLGQNETARLIRDAAIGISVQRSRVIARTETHGASGGATTAALEVQNLPMVREEWVSAEDGRTREAHVIADGQIVDQGQPFIVGGERLMYPGDPSGSAANIISCRCVTAAVVEDEEDLPALPSP